jgi:hypothetical protein
MAAALRSESVSERSVTAANDVSWTRHARRLTVCIVAGLYPVVVLGAPKAFADAADELALPSWSPGWS